MRIEAVSDIVFMQVDKDGEERSKGGIVLPETSTYRDRADLPQRGTVVAVGDGAFTLAGTKLPAPEVNVGDRVIFRRNSGIPVKIGREQFVTVPYREVFAVVEVSDECD